MNYINWIKTPLLVGAIMAKSTSLMAMDDSSLTDGAPKKTQNENTSEYFNSPAPRAMCYDFLQEDLMIEDGLAVMGGSGSYDSDVDELKTKFGDLDLDSIQNILDKEYALFTKQILLKQKLEGKAKD